MDSAAAECLWRISGRRTGPTPDSSLEVVVSSGFPLRSVWGGGMNQGIPSRTWMCLSSLWIRWSWRLQSNVPLAVLVGPPREDPGGPADVQDLAVAAQDQGHDGTLRNAPGTQCPAGCRSIRSLPWKHSARRVRQIRPSLRGYTCAPSPRLRVAPRWERRRARRTAFPDNHRQNTEPGVGRQNGRESADLGRRATGAVLAKP